MSGSAYLPRHIERKIQSALKIMGGIALEGVRACGKTQTGLEVSNSNVRFDVDTQIRDLVTMDPGRVLSGETPRLIDEWQLAPEIWNRVRYEIDSRRSPGQFILTGSATPAYDVTRHTGAGRISRLKMRTMTIAEMQQSTGEVRLSQLGEDKISGTSNMTHEQWIMQILKGGWPALLEIDEEAGWAEFLDSYVKAIYQAELEALSEERFSPHVMERVMRSLARNVSSEITFKTISADVAADGSSISPKSVRRYLDRLEAIFVVEEVPAWSVNLASRSRLRTSAKYHLADPSLACAVLKAKSERLIYNPAYVGLLFESLVVHDLAVMVEALGGSIYHYRDNTGLEIDIILEFADGSWAGVEVKYGPSQIQAAAENLIKLRDERVDLDTAGKPRFLAVVTGTQWAYTLDNGVHVIPLDTLTI